MNNRCCVFWMQRFWFPVLRESSWRPRWSDVVEERHRLQERRRQQSIMNERRQVAPVAEWRDAGGRLPRVGDEATFSGGCWRLLMDAPKQHRRDECTGPSIIPVLSAVNGMSTSPCQSPGYIGLSITRVHRAVNQTGVSITRVHRAVNQTGVCQSPGCVSIQQTVPTYRYRGIANHHRRSSRLLVWNRDLCSALCNFTHAVFCDVISLCNFLRCNWRRLYYYTSHPGSNVIRVTSVQCTIMIAYSTQ